eukprot:2521794-Rhodomonas_salina.1
MSPSPPTHAPSLASFSLPFLLLFLPSSLRLASSLASALFCSSARARSRWLRAQRRVWWAGRVSCA